MGAESSEAWVVWLLLAAVPLVLATSTAFAKSAVVLGGLRIGLGAEMLLPWAIVLALALVVTAVIMGPTGIAVWERLLEAGGLPALADAPARALEVLEPLLAFMQRHSDVLVPAFLVTELTEALLMVVLILVPLLLLDVLGALVFALVGLAPQALPLVTLPFKLLLFLVAGGWDVVIGGLVEGYR